MRIAPFSPPFIALAFVSSSNFPFFFPGLWHLMQDSLMIGATSVSKSILLLIVLLIVGRGSFPSFGGVGDFPYPKIFLRGLRMCPSPKTISPPRRSEEHTSELQSRFGIS